VTTVTDLEGRYLLEGIAFEATELTIRHPDYGQAYLSKVERNGSYNNLNWDTMNSVVEVIVIDQKSKEPIQGASIAFSEGQLQQIVSKPEEPNLFFLEGSRHSRVILSAKAENYTSPDGQSMAYKSIQMGELKPYEVITIELNPKE
ncbi:MAG: hypothetical protein SFY68_08855, partial [Candidatus Sumerlaeia bacterium]|nr:hypothetical protein [Candidatus Sumerlaeia bacterium]